MLADALARAGACAGAAGTSSGGRPREQRGGGHGEPLRHAPSVALASGVMEAAATPKRELSGEKAQRIVDAMRATVGARGATGATFDVVAREAGVSRGLLHYYFGTKERLLAEVVRRDCDLRMERLSATTAGAAGAQELLASMAVALREMLEESPEFLAILLELHTLGRHNAEIAGELAELHRRVRGHLGGILAPRADGRRGRRSPRSPRSSPRCSSRSPTGSACGCWPSRSATSSRRSRRRCARPPRSC